jgi:hypothetical protein
MPAAASIAALRAVVSTSSGRVTGSPVTSARICPLPVYQQEAASSGYRRDLAY